MSVDQAVRALAAVAGPENVLGPEEAASLSIGGRAPALGAIFPETIEQVQETIKLCSASHWSVIPHGGGTMAACCSRPASFDIALVSSRLTQITDYQPENLVFAAQAGLTGKATYAALAEHGQLLPLDPPRFNAATLGGIVAGRASGPARYAHGTPRDALIGVQVINADGEIVKGGGKVVKNVSGYDLCKLYCGSLGTLGVIVETVFKLAPLPEESLAVIAAFSTWEDADLTTALVMDSPLQPRCIEAFNRSAAVRLDKRDGVAAPVFLAVIFDGIAEQVDYQRSEFTKMAEGCAASDVMEADCPWNCEFHGALSGLAAMPGEGSLFVIRGLPLDVPVFASEVEAICEQRGIAPRIAASAGSGLVHVAVDGLTSDGHIQLVDALKSLTTRVPGVSLSCFHSGGSPAETVWCSETPGIEIMKGVKSQLDPQGVFPAGRFVGGI